MYEFKNLSAGISAEFMDIVYVGKTTVLRTIWIRETNGHDNITASDENSAGAEAVSHRQLFYLAVVKLKHPHFFIAVKESGSYE